MRESRKHAVVCGASMAGLLAARVLSDFYQSVTVVERDELPTTASQRRGVSQGRHLHMLLTRGLNTLIELFPGLLDELADAGALVLDGTDPSLFYLRAGSSEMSVSGSFTRPDELRILLASRPLLEGHVRRRLRAIENVTVIDGHDVIEPTIDSGRVTGVSVVDRKTGQERRLNSDLLIGATGRGGRIPAFLQTHGYRGHLSRPTACN
jgi:2-polyprenyl-6-methoxyphenol hydroxylase-like FAD-dependent oxidoreductase